MQPEHYHKTVAGCRISIRHAGQGEPLLLLHGAGGASRWEPFMDALSERYHVIVPEHPGFGGSEMPGWLDNIGDLAYFYLDFLEDTGLSDVNLVGCSLGGWIAAEIAVRQSIRLKSLTLSAAAGLSLPDTPKGDVFIWSPEERVRNVYVDQSIADSILAQPLSEEDQDLQLRNNLAFARVAWQPRLFNPDLHKWLHRIDVPTLLLWGEQDKIIPAAFGPAYRSLITNAELVTIPNCGHAPQIESKDRFVSEIDAFIGRARS
jgi:pimeloyl-ACP methyl ester carboxylesterase